MDLLKDFFLQYEVDKFAIDQYKKGNR